MDHLSGAAWELQGIDELSRQDSPVHRLHPLIKLILTILYILTVVSVPRYALSGLIPLVIFPLVAYSAAGIPVRTGFIKLRYVLPLVCAVGIWNPILDRTPVMTLGALTVSAGMLSFATLLLKGVYALMASFLLVATTGIDRLCAALRLIRIPEILVTQLMITFRYLSLLLSEAGTMFAAYRLRAPGQKGLHYKSWGSFLGQLLLRSMDRATMLYQSMEMRGFDGSFRYAATKWPGAGEWALLGICAAAFLALRVIPVAELLGRLITGA